MGSAIKVGPVSNLSFITIAGSDKPFTGPGNASTSNNVYATADLTDSGFTRTNFIKSAAAWRSSGFASGQIPTEAVIVGIQVLVERSFTLQSNGGTPKDYIVQIEDGTNTSNNKATAALWTASDSTVTYGGNGDTWGLPQSTLTSKIVTTTSFKVGIAAQIDQDPNLGSGPGYGCRCRIDAITCAFWYSWLDGLYMVGNA
jgi:hypothetical protein